MIEAVKALTAEYDMLPRGGAVLCAVSGGADSMCLLHLLSALAEEGGFRVEAAHYHHGMRGAAADADAAFVADWCRARDIPCAVERGDVYGEAARLGLGVEETGRRLRYDFLRRTARARGCGRIATAHNADDNLETLLLHLARGAGLHGLAGIPPRRGEIVRPLLTTSRAEIGAYLGVDRSSVKRGGDQIAGRLSAVAPALPAAPAARRPRREDWEGRSEGEVAAALGIAPAAYYRLACRDKPVGDLPRLAYEVLRLGDLSIPQCARHLGMSESSVRAYRRRYRGVDVSTLPEPEPYTPAPRRRSQADLRGLLSRSREAGGGTIGDSVDARTYQRMMEVASRADP